MELFVERNLPPLMAVVLFLVNAFMMRKGIVSIHEFGDLHKGIKVVGCFLLIVAVIVPVIEVMYTIYSFILIQLAYLMCFTFCLYIEK